MNSNERIKIIRKKGRELWSNIPHALVVAPELSATQLRVYLVLDTYANCDTIYPSYQNIADKSNIHRDTAYTTINDLDLIELIKKINCTEEDGQTTSNEYEIYDYTDWVVKYHKEQGLKKIEELSKLYSLNLEQIIAEKREEEDITVADGTTERYVHIKQSILFDTTLSSSEFRVFLVLKLYEGLSKICPNLETLTKQSCLSKPTLVTAIKGLIEKEFIGKSQGGNLMNGRKSNNYIILK